MAFIQDDRLLFGPKRKQQQPTGFPSPVGSVGLGFGSVPQDNPAPIRMPSLTVPSGLPAAPSYGPTGPSFSPSDLLGALESDPLYVQQKADLGAQRVSDLAARAAARQRAITLFGEVPDFTGQEGLLGENFLGDINDVTRGLASQSTKAGLSTVARIDEADRDARENLRNVLAARGILSSGETGYQLGRADTAYRRTQFDARQQLLDYLAGVHAGFVQAERARQQALANAALAASGRLQPQFFGGGGGGGGPGSTSAPPYEPPDLPPYTGAGVQIQTGQGPTQVFPGDFKLSTTRQGVGGGGIKTDFFLPSRPPGRDPYALARSFAR